MKRIGPILTLLTITTSIASAKPADPTPTTAPADETPDAKQTADRPRHVLRREHELHYLTNLRRAINTELRLADDQHRAIRELFNDHIRLLQQYTPDPEDEKDIAQAQQRRRELARRLRKARRNGDRQKVEKLLAELQSVRATDPLRQATRTFHQALADALEPMQREQFYTIVRRLYRVDRPMEQRARGLRQIRRALDRLTLRPEQQKAVREHFHDAMESFGAQGWKPDRAQAVITTLRRNILGELDDDQRVAFQAALERLQSAPERVAPPRGAGHPARPRHRPPPPVDDRP